MRRTKIENAGHIEKIPIQEAISRFIKHCRVKNLSPQTIGYYTEDCEYFAARCGKDYIDEVDYEVLEDFIFQELEKGKKVSSLNTRIRGLRVFFNFCADRDYMAGFKFDLLKEDKKIKEPYTDAELQKLLARPRSTSWVEWRMWAAVNYMVGTGNRISTVVNVQIRDIDFREDTIRLTTLKNRKQQIIPLSKALKGVLRDYLKTWDYTIDDYLFPSCEGGQLTRRSFQSALARYNVSRGVSKTSAHLFRHTYAKNFVMAGGGMVQLQTLLGHSTMEMSRHYISVYGLDLKRDYDKLNPLDTFLKRNDIAE